MTGYEQRVYAGWKKSAGDLLKDQKMVANALKNCLGVEIEKVLPSGEVINLPIVYDLIGDLIRYWKDHPEKIDLKVLSTVLGETKQEIAIESETATDIFKGVVAGAKPNNDSNT